VTAKSFVPWHGLRFGAVVLGNGGRDSWRYLQVTVRYKGGHLEVAETAPAQAAASLSQLAS
jgi:hypothetical protein